MSELPILYSFRRCPYAMRARLAVFASGNSVELREVVLRDKPEAMLEASPKGTVPVMVMRDGTVLEESLDIIDWSLENAVENSMARRWFGARENASDAMCDLIIENDGPFKDALDAYKYPNKFPDSDHETSRENGAQFIRKLDELLVGKSYLLGDDFTVFDASILPFIRQFAHVDQDWFYAQDWSNVIGWLDAFKESDRFASIMPKFKQWKPEDPATVFGG